MADYQRYYDRQGNMRMRKKRRHVAPDAEAAPGTGDMFDKPTEAEVARAELAKIRALIEEPTTESTSNGRAKTSHGR